MGIHSALDLKHADPRDIKRQSNVVVERTVAELNGISCLALEDVTPAKQQIIASRSFAELAYHFDTLVSAISHHACRTAAALAGLRRVYRPGYSYKKAGVVLLEIGPADRVQPDLFAPTPDQRRGRVMAVMDHINRKHGRGTLRLVCEKLHGGWAMRQEKRSPRWTTCWGCCGGVAG